MEGLGDLKALEELLPCGYGDDLCEIGRQVLLVILHEYVQCA